MTRHLTQRSSQPGLGTALVGLAVCIFVVVSGACDLRPTLAQLRLFSGYRADLVDQCCDCLARRGTGAETASCEEGVFVDGGVRAPDGAVVGSGDRDNDNNDSVDEGEVPCLCGGLSAKQCRAALTDNDGIVVPGACIDELDVTAPCENACAGVLSFEPVAGGD